MRNDDNGNSGIKLMKDPKSWAMYPMLPVKKISDNHKMPEFGFLLATGKSIVFLKNVFDLDDLGIRTVKDIIEKVDKEEYPSFEDIVKDGWIVD
jgi:hypothetical protein